MMDILYKYIVPSFLVSSEPPLPQTAAEKQHDLISFAALVIILMLMFYISVGIYIE